MFQKKKNSPFFSTPYEIQTLTKISKRINSPYTLSGFAIEGQRGGSMTLGFSATQEYGNEGLTFEGDRRLEINSVEQIGGSPAADFAGCDEQPAG